MEIERAIEILNPDHREHYESIKPVNEACKMGMEALKKQIPIKPDYEGDGCDENGEIIYDTAYCPTCRYEFEVYYDATDYCPKCGQRLDWSEKE